jgi:hypothetical protein
MKQTVLLIITSLLIGILFGRYAQAPEKIEIIKEVKETNHAPYDLEKISRQLQEIEQTDLVELKKLRGERDYYLRANEIYGKVFQLFLVNLGLQLNRPKWQTIMSKPNGLLNPKEKVIVKNNCQRSPPSQKARGPEIYINGEIEEESRSFKSKFWKKNTIAFRRTKKKSNHTNQSENYHPQLFRFIQGNWRGIITSLPNIKKVQLIIRAHYKFVRGQWEGDGEIRLFDDQEALNHHQSSSGKNIYFQPLRNNPRYLTISLTDSSYLSLLYHPGINIFSGFYFKKDPKTKIFEPIGEIKALIKF